MIPAENGISRFSVVAKSESLLEQEFDRLNTPGVQRKVYNLAYRILRSGPNAAEDALQKVRIKAWRNLDAYDRNCSDNNPKPNSLTS